MEKAVETPYLKLWEEKGVLHCTFSDNLHIDFDVAKHCVEQRITFSQGRSYPCLIDMKGVKAVTKAARDYLAEEGSQYIKAGAFIAGSAFNVMLGNLFLQVNKPKVPTRLFSDEEQARKWLEEFKD